MVDICLFVGCLLLLTSASASRVLRKYNNPLFDIIDDNKHNLHVKSKRYVLLCVHIVSGLFSMCL